MGLLSHPGCLIVLMGSQGIFEHTYEDTEPSRAFRRLVERDARESGSGTYAGNMTGMPNFRVYRQTPLTVWEAKEVFAEREGRLAKWEPGEAVALLPETAVSNPKVRTMKINVLADHKRSEEQGEYFNYMDAVKTAVAAKMKEGQRITDIRVVDKDCVHDRKVVKSKGAASRRFIVARKSFDTFEGASEYALVHAAKWGDGDHLSIIEEVVRGGEPKAKVVSRVKKHIVTVDVSYVTVPASKNVVGGWAFYGYVPC